jgi:hypothetical protein
MSLVWKSVENRPKVTEPSYEFPFTVGYPAKNFANLGLQLTCTPYDSTTESQCYSQRVMALGALRIRRIRSEISRLLQTSLDYHPVLQSRLLTAIYCRTLHSFRLSSRRTDAQVRSCETGAIRQVLRRFLSPEQESCSKRSFSPESTVSRSRKITEINGDPEAAARFI